MARVLVTGGAGFVGSTLCRLLADLGHEVVETDLGAEERHDAGRFAAPTARHLRVDLHRVDLDELLGDVDAVAHLAGRPGVQTSWESGFAGHVEDNVLLTQRLLESARRTGVGRVVVASSSSVYGDVGDGLAAEDRPLAPLSPYGATKATVEHLVHAYAARGVDAVALRFFTVYGRRQRPDMAVARLIEAALGGDPFPLRGDGLQERDLTHVDDVAAATAAALVRPVAPGTICNVGAGRPTSLRAIIDLVAERLGPVPVVDVPAAPGDPRRTAADPSAARRLLGWRPTVSLADGISDQIEHRLHDLRVPSAA